MVCSAGTCMSKVGVAVSCWATRCCFPGANLTVSLQAPAVHFSCIYTEFDSKCCLDVSAEAPHLLAVAGMPAPGRNAVTCRCCAAGQELVQGQGLICPLCHLPAFTWPGPAGCCRFYAQKQGNVPRNVTLSPWLTCSA